ncbi:MAG: imidazolonepropionase [Chloroflexota bacterium]|nr:imidazolonepropionase [Chloroflexota bacterium]
MALGTTLLTGSGRLCLAQRDPALRAETLSPWALVVRDARIAWVGPPSDVPADLRPDGVVDLDSALVTAGLVNAHTHPLFAGDRSDEAAARLAGEPYSGGGILRTVAATRAASDGELVDAARGRLRAELAAGTTTVECKSGYGLSTDEELRSLRLIGLAAERVPVRVLRTFLGAHAVPAEAASAADYAGVVADDMLPEVARGGLAEFCDVFCDRGFFSLEETERILSTAGRLGLGMRMHADQLTRSGATELGVRLGVTSVDHLEQLDAAGIAALAGSSTVATLLPAPAAVLRSRMPPARALLDAGVTVALASDANAGTFGGWGQMPLIVGLGATLLGMTVEEALAAATAGGAASLGIANDRGRVAPGFAADLVAWDAEHEGAFALNLGAVRAERVWVGGAEVLG